MEIQNIKTIIINEIKLKLVSILEEPTFSTKTYKHSFETRCNPTYNDFKNLPNIIHIHLQLLLNMSNKVAKRYQNHYIRINIKKYKNHNYSSILDIVDIVYDKDSKATLKDRTIECLMSMNSVIMTYKEAQQTNTSALNDLLNNLQPDTYYTISTNNKINEISKIVGLPIFSPQTEVFTLKVSPMTLEPNLPSFGECWGTCTVTHPLSQLKQLFKPLSKQDIEEHKNKLLNEAISKTTKYINQKQKEIEQLQKDLENLNLKRIKTEINIQTNK